MTAARPLLLAALSVGLGCATVSVQTEYDAKTDFAKFKTYDFITAVPGQEQAPSVRNPVVREWINAAIQRKLAGKGCSRANLPKLEEARPKRIQVHSGERPKMIEGQSRDIKNKN